LCRRSCFWTYGCPASTGLEVCRRIRKANLHHVPVVFLTNFDGAEFVRSAFEAGGDDYILKCNGTKGVIERVRYWCRRGRDSEMQRRRESILTALRNGQSPQLVEDVREPETVSASGTDG
jgi:DNA-binding response OmpR family regulator